MTLVAVTFQYRQAATVKVKSRCMVPANIIKKGRLAVVDYLTEHGDKWEDGDYDITDFGEQLSGALNPMIAGKDIL